MRLLARWGALALAFWLATNIVPGITVNGGVRTYFWVALLFGMINALLGSFIKIVTLPATILTLGLFLIIVNTAMLSLTARWSDKFDVTGFWSALWASVIISVTTSVLSVFYKKAPRL